MNTFDRFFAFLQDPAREGAPGFDSQDSGGLTRFGISKANNPDVDVEHLTEDQAKQLYRDRYWDPCRCELLPSGIAFVVADIAVNQGVGRAKNVLQLSLNVKQDGVIGDITLVAAHGQYGPSLIAELIAQRNFAYGLIPQFLRYGLGWSRRSAACHQAALQIMKGETP